MFKSDFPEIMEERQQIKRKTYYPKQRKAKKFPVSSYWNRTERMFRERRNWNSSA
jgi:hypothetical protein